ncbi:MFS transporter [Nocardia rhamnosiphila]
MPATPSLGADDVADPRTRGYYIKSVFAGSIGNMIEWFDWFVYTTFAIYFAGQFFPKGDATAQLLNTAAIFAVGFLARPLGGWLLGRLSDRQGRKAGLTITVTMMSFSALLIAVAPGFDTAGYLGAAMLVVARILQGLSVGGEYATSAAYLTEMSKKGWRGLGGSFQYVSVTLGQIAGVLLLIVLQFLLTEQQLDSWGWRIPFVLGAVAAVAVFYLRRGMHETEAYAAVEQDDVRGRRGTLAEVWKHRRAAFLVLTLTLGGSVAYYTYTTYLTSYLVNSVGLPKEDAAQINFLALVVFLFLLPLGGYISDRIGRRPVLIFFGLGTTVFTYPILQGMQQSPTWLWCLLYTLLGLTFVAGYSSVNAVVKAELFPTEVRTVGVAIPYNVAQAVFGGTASYLALALRDAGHESYFFVYVSVCAAISLLTYVFMRETRDVNLVGSAPAAPAATRGADRLDTRI